MKTTKLGVLLSGILAMMPVFGTGVFAQGYPEVSCANLPSANSCSQCFNAGALYQGYSRKGIYDDFVNTSSNTYVYYDDENPTPYSREKLQPTTTWSLSSPLFYYVNNSKYDTFWRTSNAGRLYHIFDPNFTDKYLQSATTGGLSLDAVAAGTDPKRPAFLLNVDTKYRQFLGNGKLGDLTHHRECFYYYANWCGDGTVQSDKGETCDPADPNRTGRGVNGCSATCQPLNPDPVYDLALTKRVTDKKSHYKKGDTVTFTITVFNQGNQTAKNLEITDYIPAGLEVVDAAWTVAGDKATRTIAGPILAGQSTSVTLKMRIKPDFTGTEILNLAEITRDNSGEYGLTDKDSTPDQNKDNDCFQRNNLHNINGNGKAATKDNCNESTDEDDHDGDSLQLLDQIYDLALTKTLVDQRSVYSLGDELTFRITVYNQGELVARNLEISDYLPAGLELIDPNWTLTNGIAKTKIAGPINPKDVAVVTMKVKIKSDFKGSRIINKAEISKDNAGDYGTTDVDSTPDTNANNDCYIDGKHIVTGNGKDKSKCDETTDEDDHDGVEIVISKPTIKKDLQEVGKIYEVGDLVGFVMPFANNTNETVYNVSIKDFLPKNLEYVSSEISGVTPTVHTTTKGADGVTVDLWSGFNLLPGQKGTLYLTGRVLESNYDSRLNTVGIFTNDILVEKDSEQYELGGRKVMIEKTVDKHLVHVGESALYRIKVSVVSGSYDELVVTDTLPKGLVYQEGTYQLTGLMANTEVVSFSTGKNAQGLDVLTWKLRFPNKISAGKSFTIALYAKLTEKTQKKYTNIACVEDPKKPNDGPICDPEDITPPRPKPNDPTMEIKKYVNRKEQEAGREDVLMTGFSSGDIAYFTLEVQNATAGFSEFTITDTVTGNLTYIDSSKLLNNAFTGVFLRGAFNSTDYAYKTALTTENLGNNQTKLTWKVTMTNGQFLPGDKYRVQFMARVTGDQKNVAILNYPGGTPKEDDASVKSEEVKLKIKKYVSTAISGTYVDDNLKTSNSTVFFKLVISGATNSLTGFTVKDRIENNLQFDYSSTGLADNAFTGVIAFGANNPSKPAYKITPTMTGTHPTDVQWKVEMLNGAFMPGDSLTIIFKATKKGSQKNIAHVYYPKRDGTEGHDEDPASVSDPSSGGGGSGGGGGGGSPYCGDGRQNGAEFCDLGGKGVIGADGKLFKYTSVYNTDYAGWTCNANCSLEKKGTNELPKCFNVQNGSISIMKGEVLPFYWNIEGLLGKRSNEDKQKYLQNTFFFSNQDDSCREQDNGKIDLRTMQCTFAVYGPGNMETNAPLYNFEVPCVNLSAWTDAAGKVYPRLQKYVEQNKQGWLGGSELVNDSSLSTKKVFDTLDNWAYPTLLPLSSKLLITNFGTTNAQIRKSVNDIQRLSSINITTFGEYKVALERMEYKTCQQSQDKKGNSTYTLSTKKEGYDRICEVDFAVTDPYMIQRSPYGIGNKATVALNQYKLINGTSFMDQFFKTTNTTAAEYKTPASIKSLFTTFKNKYLKLAKKVAGKNGLSKVPGKAIYLVSGEEINLKNLISDTSKPFTLIATSASANITVNGDVNSNAMIMTQGTITFDASNSCNGSRIPGKHAGQVVKGIYYAGNGFRSAGYGALRNTVDNLSNGEWCNYGNLHIKGVAIGDLTQVVKDRRSELYTWFEGKAGGKSGAEKVQKVIYGASVLVDYNPTLRGNLPPGANEFNKALAVYRK